MDTTHNPDELMADQDNHITETVRRERGRLGSFIRKRVADASEAEDILQDVFFELVEAYRLPEPIEQVGAWLFRVARNRIIDRFRKKKEVALPDLGEGSDDEEWLDQILRSADGGPEAAYARNLMLAELYDALDELPEEQRDAFVGHEIEGQSFKEMSAATGLGVNTLLARKRYAVLHLRVRLQDLLEEFN
ncbi:RNA polymerase sigma factor [Undibacterium sp. JH2W]|uniref:RNA polymerase sigma factor n=1 Tax=Undibacterium sp. JH2W TaxID=3413037 RepID=UPI003BF027A2